VQARPSLNFEVDGHSARYVATPSRDPDDRRRLRALMRAKYGLRDVWPSLLFDTSRSVSVRLTLELT